MTAYTDHIKAICGGSLLALWPGSDISGNVTDASGNGRNLTATALTYGNPGIGDGGTSLGFNGTSSQAQAAAVGYFNGATGTLAGWCKVSAAGDWSDTTSRTALSIFADASNFIQLRKRPEVNVIQHTLVFGGSSFTPTYTTAGPTDWFFMAATWDASYVRCYYNLVQFYSNARAGTWAGSPAISLGTGSWKGGLYAGFLAGRALDAAQLGLVYRIAVTKMLFNQEITRTISRTGAL